MIRRTTPLSFVITHSTVLTLLLFGLFVSPAYSASSIQLTWNANTESDLAGYKIYKRTLPSQDFGQPIFSGMPNNPSSPSTTVSGLSGGATYGFIATAFDTSGNESAPSTEAPITLPTSPPPPPPPADTTAPTVTLTAPSAGTVSGTVTVSASASDNVGVTGVQFRLQGANLGPDDTTNPYSTSWDTTTVANGSYTLTAIARDAAGNTKTAAPLTVTVSNTSTPPADTTSPSVPQTLTLNSTSDTQVTFSWTASTDNIGVTGYDVARNNVVIGQSTTNAFADGTTSPGKTYSYTVRAKDANGNVSAWSAPLQFTTSQVLIQLNVSVSGNGTVASTPDGINCPTQSCLANYTNETLVTLTAIPENGWTFSGWSGSCTGTGPCSITLTENRSVNANFSKVRKQRRRR